MRWFVLFLFLAGCASTETGDSKRSPAAADGKARVLRKSHPELAKKSLCFLEDPESLFLVTGFFTMTETQAFMGVAFANESEYGEFLQKKCDVLLSKDGSILSQNERR
jgi:hypothetical protein